MTKPFTHIPERPFLTDAQKKVLAFIETYMDDKGYPPTLREIAEAVGVSAKSTVQLHVRALERKGYLEIAGSRALQMRVIR